MTKQRCTDVLKKQQEKEKIQAEKHKDKSDNINNPRP